MEYINGAWRATSPNEAEPKQDIKVGFINSGNSDSITYSGSFDWPTNKTTIDYCDYYYRWDGIRWVYEPDWTWIPVQPQVPFPPDSFYQWAKEIPNYSVLAWKGKTILYRFVNNYIEYTILKATTTTNLQFQTTINLEEILKGLE
jgi:hypothetical protein